MDLEPRVVGGRDRRDDRQPEADSLAVAHPFFGKTLERLKQPLHVGRAETPVPGRLTAMFRSVKTSPAWIAQAATKLLRATARLSNSEGVGRFTPLPKAFSTLRMALTMAASSWGSRLAA